MLEPFVIVQDGTREPDPTAGENGATGGMLQSLLPFILIGVVFWMLIIAPERKNRRRRQEMLSNLKKGDEVLTSGGLFGRVSRVDKETVTLVVADGVRLRFSRASVQALVDEGGEREGASPGRGSRDDGEPPEGDRA